MAGGIGNAYTTYAASNGTASDEEMSRSFIIGGAFNIVSLGTSWTTYASNMDDLMRLGIAKASGNFVVGMGISVGTSMVTGFATSTNKTTSPAGSGGSSVGTGALRGATCFCASIR